MTRVFSISLVALLLWVGPARAAKKNVVILKINGPHGWRAKKVLNRALRGQVRLVSSRRFRQLAREQGQLMAARMMQVSGIIRGSIARSAKRWIFMFTVNSGHNLKAVGSAMVPLRGARLDPISARRAATKIGLIMAWTRAAPRMARARPRRRAVPPPRQTRPEPKALPQALPRAPTQPVARPQVYAPPRKVPVYRDDNGGDLSAGDGVPVYTSTRSVVVDEAPDNLGFKVKKSSRRQRRERHDTSSSDREPWESLIEVSAGMMALSRRMSFEYPQGVDKLKGLPNYRSGFVPALRLEGAVYPLITIGGPLANLGLTGRYFRAFGLQYQMENQPSLSVTLHGFELGLRYRWNILRKCTSPTLHLGLELGRTAFVIWNDQNLNLYLPSLAYLYLKLAASLDVPVYATRTFSIGLFAGFEYLPIFSAGMIAETDEAGYGPQPTGGIDVGGGAFLSYKGFFGRGSGFYRQISYDFEHACQQGCADSGSASDVYLSFSLSVGYAY
jgi:hypothetical protein